MQLTARFCDVAKFISVVRERMNLTVPSASHQLHCVCFLVPFVRQILQFCQYILTKIIIEVV